MNLDQLEVFLEVAAKQHVTQAAHALNMTQSAVSAAISALERRHGVILFNRIGRGIQLTEVGRRFIPLAEAVVARAAEAAVFLEDIDGGRGGFLRVQASQTVASYFLPRYLVHFRNRYPRVSLEFLQGNTSSVELAVLAGNADVGVVEGRIENSDLDIVPIAGDRLALLVSKNHPWADGRTLADGDLTRVDWVLREVGSGTRSAFEKVLQDRNMSADALRVILELPSNEACIAATEEGGCATILSILAAAPHIAQGQIVSAGYELPKRSISALTDRRRHTSAAVVNFLDVIRDERKG